MTPAHADPVLAIYQAGLDTGDASFETAAPRWAEFDRSRLPDHRFVALDQDGAVVGWIAATAVSPRPVYAGVVEHSVYIASAAQGRGVGVALLRTFIASTEAAGIWTIETKIFPENTASIAVHRKVGFTLVGVRRKLGRHRGRWRDVVQLERRSAAVE